MADSPYVTTQISGPREEVVKVGSVVTFHCSAVHRLNGSEGGRVTWLKDGRPVEKHESPRGGVSVYTEWKPHNVVSRLTLIASDTEDNGAYSCSIPGSGTDTVMLLIDEGKGTGNPSLFPKFPKAQIPKKQSFWNTLKDFFSFGK